MADVEYRYVEQSKRSAARTVKAGLTIPRWTESRLGIAISLLCPPSTWNAIRLRNDIRVVPLYPPPTLSSRGAFLSSSPFALDFSPNIAHSISFRIKIQFDCLAIYVRLPYVYLRSRPFSSSLVPERNPATLRRPSIVFPTSCILFMACLELIKIWN